MVIQSSTSKPASDHYDLAIVGAGIIGLATAREVLMRHPGLRVVVLEKRACDCQPPIRP